MEEEPKEVNKELMREESWHQEVKVVLRGARGTELDMDIITVGRTENNVLVGEQMLEESCMMVGNIWYKKDMFKFK